jgi:23S rRNA pseudouridine2605 synthase
MKERLYPVGRLDYLSEGLLVVTNDGELANRLTKASSGVEKTYLVKVSGQPTEAELNILRSGVAIERGRPGSPPVRTSPARIRQVRQGDNPWYEVVLIEGRNRELRKMFEEIGHFVEKIRRVGYGPLVLDQEPGSLRELQPAELDALRKAAEGKLRTPKSKDLRRRNLLDAGQLPTVLPKPSSRQAWKKEDRPARPPARFAAASTGENRPAPVRPGDFRPQKFATDRPSEFQPKKFGKGRTSEFRPKKFGADRNRASRPTRPADSFASGAANKFFRPARPGAEGFRPPAGRSFDHPPARPASRPAWKKDDRAARQPARFAAGSTGESRPGIGRPFTAKPAWRKLERPASGRAGFDRSSPARAARVFNKDLGPVRPPNLHIEEIAGPARPFTTSSGKPRAGGARPGWKPRPNSPGKPTSSSSRPYTPRTEGATGYRPTKTKPYPNSTSRAERKAGPGWKPKPGSAGKPAFGSRSRPKSGASTDRSSSGRWKSGYKAKPGGKKRS